jgi:hypothetical protein
MTKFYNNFSTASEGISCLFCHVVSVLDCITSIVGWPVSDDLERIWEGNDCSIIDILPRYLHEGTEEDHNGFILNSRSH